MVFSLKTHPHVHKAMNLFSGAIGDIPIPAIVHLLTDGAYEGKFWVAAGVLRQRDQLDVAAMFVDLFYFFKKKINSSDVSELFG